MKHLLPPQFDQISFSIPQFDKTSLPMPIFNYLLSNGGLENSTNEDETNSLHFSEHNDHSFDFYIANELHEFVMEVDEEDIEAVNPPVSIPEEESIPQV